MNLNSLLSLYGCQALCSSDVSLTKRHLAIVLGGRIRNEAPEVPRLSQSELIISMDLESCYGRALEYISYPIGHPILIYYPQHTPEDWMTLEEFLQKWEGEFVDNCWYCVCDTVTEQLSFEQDVLFSKHLGASGSPSLDPEAKVEESFHSDDGHVKGTFMLLSREVHNAILTSSSLSIIRLVSSNHEWSELKQKLKVKAAMIYPRSLMVEYTDEHSYERWKSCLNATWTEDRKIRTICDSSGHTVQDKRVSPWMKFPLSKFITPLIQERRQVKGKMNALKHTSERYLELNARQLTVKGVTPYTGPLLRPILILAHHALQITLQIWLEPHAG